MGPILVPVLLLGFLGQGLFAGRVLLQWAASERAGRSVVPRGYWHLSLAGAVLVLAYGFLVHSLVYVLSVAPGAVIAARNLRLRRAAERRELIPWAIVLGAVVVWSVEAQPHAEPAFWAVLGVAGSLLWSGRFLTQWWISERAGFSLLPRLFWIQSLAGSGLLLAYALFRHDPVMVAGYGFGCVPYVRNLMLLRSAPGSGAPRPSVPC